MTGQTNVQGMPRLILNEVLINGDPEVGSYRKRLWIDKGDGAPSEEELGKNLNVIFLKIRRKLVERGKKGEILRSTGEHNGLDDRVKLYEGGQEVFAGSAREARRTYEGMRTVQVVYALLLHPTKEPELVRLTVKGASLGSDNKPKDVMTFYQYLGLYEREPICTYVTKLGVVREEGMKPYFAMTFTQGPKVEKLMPVVEENLQRVHEYCQRYDKGLVLSDKEIVPEADPYAGNALAGEFGDDYPKDEINPEDIPF